MSAPVIAILLLKPEYFEPSQRKALYTALDAIGLDERTEGRASITVRVKAALFEGLFGVQPVPVSARPAGSPPDPSDHGAPPGYVGEREPTVPASLNEFVASVGVEPPMTRF